ncbi:potassium channel family protein [Lewinella sp. 4G2]|uniref:potassium channel family protein n=1 Tax=Lewinella sp. 4G2 TaxID=1803372 RepID=UPI0007B4A51B|nr:potassium channel family protein [Lewinella sp. 4G2]OAV45942.1 hypothetical protein A3850_018765 [Lewinella sp. 4G2]
MQIFYALRQTARRARRAVGGGIRFRTYLLGIILAILFLLHIGAMVIFEGLSFGDAAWLTITTATTVGYGDMSATTTAGRWATVLLMYIGGIFILAQLAGLVFENAQDGMERRRKGLVAIKTNNHIVIFGWREAYLRRVVREIRSSMSDLSDAEIVIVSPNLELLPEDLIKLDVIHVQGELYDPGTIAKVNLAAAARIAILPERGDDETAYTNLELISRVNTFPADVIYAANNVNALKMAEDLGAADALIFDANYPEVFARSIITVGGEDIITELIGRNGVELIMVQRPMNTTIGEIVTLTAPHGTLLGVQTSGEGHYDLHPAKATKITNQRLIYLADVERHQSDEAALQAIEDALQPLIVASELIPYGEPAKVGLIGTTKRVTDAFIESLQQELNDQEIEYLGAGVLSAGGKWKSEVLQELDAVVVMASNPTDPATDARTYLLIRQLRKLGFRGRIIAEALLPESTVRFTEIGANNILRPITRNVNILARCIATGAEEILDNLYSSTGDSELLGFEVNITEAWSTFSERIHSAGLPIAFRNDSGDHLIPTVDFVAGRGKLFLLVDTEANGNIKIVRQVLRPYLAD